MANIFPRWSNLLPLKIAFCLGTIVFGIALAFAYYATPKAQVVGYQPTQPIPFSHKIHVDQLGLDCRYCHSFVDVAGHSNVPSGNTCWNCHQHVQKDSPKLEPLHRSMDESYPGYDGKPIEWVRVHKAPDYVYFNHSAHVNRGISCQSCHGDVNKMEVVYQAESHSMGWCLDCHRAPEEHLRPLEEVYNLNYNDDDVKKYTTDSSIKTTKDLGKQLKDTFNVHPKTSCATCHR
ncbi:cytochrome c3 family protein [Luteolibacter sp. AS25]|uniref:cytochrome c3 family protein n=1 Tax=Luteolibacter sp. AS25 TaxID=3135776 RepID=UPI00398AF494